MSAMRVFVTGGTGFVGAWTTRALVAAGHEVHALVLEGDEVAATERFGADANAKVARISGNFLRPESYFGALEKLRPDACVHLAWYANPKDYLSSRINLDFLEASIKLGAKLVDLECKRFVATGTCFEYDTSIGYLSESSPLLPKHLYSVCKRALFDVLTQLTQGTRTSFTWPRLFFLYGQYEASGRLVPAVIDALRANEDARVTTGTQIRDYMHVVDAGRALSSLLAHDITGPINVASGEPVTVAKLIETIADLMNKKDRIAWGAVTARPNDPSFICANVDRLKSTGFKPLSTLEQGLAATLANKVSE